MSSIGCWNTLRSMAHAKVSLSSPDEKKIALSRKLNTLFETIPTGLNQTVSSHDKSLVYIVLSSSMDLSGDIDVTSIVLGHKCWKLAQTMDRTLLREFNSHQYLKKVSG